MKKFKKLLSLLLAAVMLLGMFAITSSAEGEYAAVTIKTDNDIAVAGDIVTVTVNVATNYNSTTMRWPVLFSSDYFELVEGSVTATDELLALGGNVPEASVNSANSFTSDYTSENYGSVLLQWTGSTLQGWRIYNKPEGMDCFTFQLKIKDDVPMNSKGDILIPENSTLFYRQMLIDVDGEITFDDIVFCETLQFSFTNAQVSNPAPELLAVEGSGTVIDRENGIIRGINPGVTDNLNDYLVANLPGEMVVYPSRDNRMGTGTTVELRLRGEVIETYTVIIAGDVNGDAFVDQTDYILYDLSEFYENTFDDDQKLAAEITGDGEVNVSDKIALDAYLIFEGSIDQSQGVYSDY